MHLSARRLGGTARTPAPFLPCVVSSRKKGQSSTIKASPSFPHTQSSSKSPRFQRQERVRRGRAAGGSTGTDWGAERAPLQLRACTPPRARTQLPTPTCCPRGSRPIRGRARGVAGGQTPQLPSLRPRGPGLAAASRPGHTHRPRRAVRARLRFGAAFPCSAPLWFPLRLGVPLRRARLRDGGSGNERDREGVCLCVSMCVCVHARGVCVCTGGPRAPLRAPLLPPALHAAMPAESLTRAPTRLGAHTRAHTRTLGRAHTPAAAHPAAHSPLSPSWGAHKGSLAPTRRSPRSAARWACRAALRPLPGWPRLRSPAAPRAGSSGVPAPPPRPARPQPHSRPEPRPRRPTPATGTPTQRRRLLAPRLRRRPQPRALSLFSFPVFCPCLSFYLLSFLPPAPIPVCSLSSICRRPLPRPLLPPLCAASHILRIALGAARRSLGPGFERAVGGEGTRRALAPPPPPLSARSAAPRSGPAGGDVPR